MSETRHLFFTCWSTKTCIQTDRRERSLPVPKHRQVRDIITGFRLITWGSANIRGKP